MQLDNLFMIQWQGTASATWSFRRKFLPLGAARNRVLTSDPVAALSRLYGQPVRMADHVSCRYCFLALPQANEQLAWAPRDPAVYPSPLGAARAGLLTRDAGPSFPGSSCSQGWVEDQGSEEGSWVVVHQGRCQLQGGGNSKPWYGCEQSRQRQGERGSDQLLQLHKLHAVLL